MTIANNLKYFCFCSYRCCCDMQLFQHIQSHFSFTYITDHLSRLVGWLVDCLFVRREGEKERKREKRASTNENVSKQMVYLDVICFD